MELVQYIIVNASLGMNKGKIAAQVAHSAVSVLEKVDEETISEWKNQGMKKIVLKVKSTEELLELFEKTKKHFPCTLITDAGKTQIASGSKTCFACGPVNEEEAQKYFKELKLL
ncbi:MAG: aminoacyl-tRNA hydrolase [archaeon]